MSPLSKDETGLGCSGLLAFLQLALCRPISLGLAQGRQAYHIMHITYVRVVHPATLL